MELPAVATFLAAMALTAAAFFLKLKATSSSRRYNLPPGPKPWPVIGNLNLMGALPHRSIHELADKYGPLMQLRLGSRPVVVGSSVDMARFFLKSHDLLFLDRPRTASGVHTTYDHANVTWSHYGVYWRQARRMYLTELFSPRHLESFAGVRADEVRALLRGLFAAASTSSSVHLNRDHLSVLSMNVITRLVLGKRYFGGVAAEEDDAAEFKGMVNELFLLNGVLNVGDWIPWLGWMDLQGYERRMKKLGKMFDAFLERVLDEHSGRRADEGDGFVARDMVDVLMEVAAGDPTDQEVKFDRVSVKAFTMELIAAGTESSSVTMEWAISELLRKPAVFAAATEELDRVVGRGRWVTEEDIPSLPYVEAIVKETMRLHPVAPLLVPPVAREDATVGGRDIPKGTHVFVNVWAIGRDPELWDAPEEFRPERFAGAGGGRTIDVKGQDFELLPFGSGRRMCPGYNLGLKVIQLTLANLLHGFTVGLPEGMKKEELSMEEVFGLSITRKHPLEVVVEPKLPAHLYA